MEGHILDKGTKLIYLKTEPSLVFGVAYYLFPLVEDPIYNHLLVSDKDLIEKITDPNTFIEMHKRGDIPFGSIIYVNDRDIRPFSETAQKRLTKRFAFIQARSAEFKAYFPKSWSVLKKMSQFDYAFGKVIMIYYFAKTRFASTQFFNKAIYPVIGIFFFDLILIFRLHGEYRQAIADLNRKKQRLETRNPLVPRSEDEDRKDKLELETLSQKLDAVRSNLLRSNRAIITVLLAGFTLLGTLYFSKRTELMLNERITTLQKENLLLKQNEKDIRQQIATLQSEKAALTKVQQKIRTNKSVQQKNRGDRE